MITNTYNPNIAIHPGKTLEEILDTTEMSQVKLAERTGLTPKTINEIIQGKNSITPETAIKLSSVFGMSIFFWNNLERNYQETLARLKLEKRLEKETLILKKFTCYSELANLNFVEKTVSKKEKIKNLLSFFGVSSLDFINKTQSVAFRKSNKKNISKESLAAWLRIGEIEAQKINTQKFDKNKLLNSIPELRALTRESAKTFIERIIQICSSFGVAVVFTPYFKKTYVDGVTKWLSSDKALIQLSLRNKRADIFWFSFFHEIGHIIKHGKKDQFIEFESKNYEAGEIKEKEADEFAQKTLISDINFDKFFKNRDFSQKAIKEFAQKIGVSSSIIAGRLAREFSIRGNNKVWGRLSYLRKRLKFVN